MPWDGVGWVGLLSCCLCPCNSGKPLVLVSEGRPLLIPAPLLWGQGAALGGAACVRVPSLEAGGERGGGPGHCSALPCPRAQGEEPLTPSPLQQWLMLPWPRRRACSPRRPQPSRFSSCSRESTTMSSRWQINAGDRPGRRSGTAVLSRTAAPGRSLSSQQLPYRFGAMRDVPECTPARVCSHSAACSQGPAHCPWPRELPRAETAAATAPGWAEQGQRSRVAGLFACCT